LALAHSQETDPELLDLLKKKNTNLILDRVPVLGTEKEIYCDTSTGKARPYVTPELRKTAFQSIHSLAHPGPRATVRQITQKFVWPNIRKDCKTWAQACLSCQRAKITRHVRAPLAEFEPTARFEHIHLDIVGPLPQSQGYTYVVTMIDRETRWPEAVPTTSITAERIAAIIVENWVSRFGAPARITTDQGRQFESELVKRLAARLGTHKNRTTAFHPQTNGKVERWHRTLKAAIKAYATQNWVEILPLIMLGLRTAISTDRNVSPAQMTYGSELRLPGEFVDPELENSSITNAPGFVERLGAALRKFAGQIRRHGQAPVYVPSELKHCSHVFLRVETKGALTQPYVGPFQIVKRDEKTCTIIKNGKEEKISVDRVKPAHMLQEPGPEYAVKEEETAKRERPSRKVRFHGVYSK
jgi:hypothetical protein